MGKTKTDYFEAKLDDRGRLSIPQELAAELGTQVVVTFGFKNYLHLYPRRVWWQDVEPMLIVAPFDEDGADRAAHLMAGKIDAELDDKQNRLLLKKHLLEYAGIEKRVACTRIGRYWRISAK